MRLEPVVIDRTSTYWIAIRVPSASRMKSARPCKMTVLSLFSMTFGKTLSVDGMLWSRPLLPVVALMYTAPFEQSDQVMWGA